MAERPRNIYMDLFSSAFLVHQHGADPVPYLIQTKDGVQLATLIKKGEDCNWPLTVERWNRGIENYFRSELGERTIADLASRFSTFWRGPLDRYSKPIEKASQVGGSNPGPVQFASWHPAFLAAAWRIAQKDKSKFDAIDILFEQVPDLDELTAFKRLREIEKGTNGEASTRPTSEG